MQEALRKSIGYWSKLVSLVHHCVRLTYLLVGIMGTSGFANAHEYWILTEQTGLERGDTVEIRGFVGQYFNGNEQIYSDRSIRAIASMYDGETAEVAVRQGDRPMGRIPRAAEGLHVVALMTNANTLSYDEFEKFADFARAHGNDVAIETHGARGLPETGFKESYFRFAKALVKVGDGAGKDNATGMPYELVALTNPYTDQGPVRFLLTFMGKPVADHHVDVFWRPDDGGDVKQYVLRTNALGEVIFDVQKGHYLVSAVRLEEPSARIKEALGVVWQSLWASTTFRIE